MYRKCRLHSNRYFKSSYDVTCGSWSDNVVGQRRGGEFLYLSAVKDISRTLECIQSIYYLTLTSNLGLNKPRIPVHTVQNLIWRFQALIIWGHLGLEKELLNPNIMGVPSGAIITNKILRIFSVKCALIDFIKKCLWLLCTHEQLYFDVIGYFGCVRVKRSTLKP